MVLIFEKGRITSRRWQARTRPPNHSGLEKKEHGIEKSNQKGGKRERWRSVARQTEVWGVDWGALSIRKKNFGL